MNNPNQERILILGADGLIGYALSVSLKRAGKIVLETSRKREKLSDQRIFLDLNEDVSSWELPDNISTVFFCAAVNSLDLCRREPVQTSRVNVEHTVKLAKRFAKSGAQVIFLSTNLVCDGAVPFAKAEAAVSPQTEHGRQKAEAEQQLLALGDLVTVLRLTKTFSADMPLLQEWISTLQNKEVIKPFSDKAVSLLPLAFVIKVLGQLADKRTPGIVQVSGDKDITYAHLAYRLAERMGIERNLVQPISARASAVALEHIPRYTTLATTRLVQELEMKVPSMDSTIDQVIKQNIATFKSKGCTEVLT